MNTTHLRMDMSDAQLEGYTRTLNGTYFKNGTNPEVIRILELARMNGTKLRLFLGDAKTGYDWMEENDVYGFIGRSTGPIKVPLLIGTADAMGGDAILTDCIVKIMTQRGRIAFVHSHYKTPELRIQVCHPLPDEGIIAKTFTHVVLRTVNEQVAAGLETEIARFKTYGKANKWIAFMRGERMNK